MLTTCRHCLVALEIPDTASGQLFLCPHCGGQFRVPPAADVDASRQFVPHSQPALAPKPTHGESGGPIIVAALAVGVAVGVSAVALWLVYQTHKEQPAQPVAAAPKKATPRAAKATPKVASRQPPKVAAPIPIPAPPKAEPPVVIHDVPPQLTLEAIEPPRLEIAAGPRTADNSVEQASATEPAGKETDDPASVFRLWQTKSGKAYEALFVGYLNFHVQLRTRPGRIVSVHLNELVDEDRAIIERMLRR